jgi:phage terminase small subunit
MSEPNLDGLGPLQIKFVEEYLKTGNATQSVYAAGYKSKNDNAAGVRGAELLRNSKISAYIQYVQSKSLESTKSKIQVSQDQIASTLVRIAFDGLEDVIEVTDKGDLEIKPDAKFDLVDGVSFSKSESDGEKGYSKSKGFSFKRSDRLKALDMLIKLMGGYEKFAGDTDQGAGQLEPQRVLKLLAKFGKR